jgi:hypothetical protein
MTSKSLCWELSQWLKKLTGSWLRPEKKECFALDMEMAWTNFASWSSSPDTSRSMPT